jgi:hypothetical protein
MAAEHAAEYARLQAEIAALKAQGFAVPTPPPPSYPAPAYG